MEPPVPDPLADLPPTARRIVETTRRLLIDRGYASLSLETIAKECGLNKTAVRYYFENKAGLMELVVDSWVHDSFRLMQSVFDDPAMERRLHAFAGAKRQMSEDRELYLAQFELLPAMLRDQRHSERLADLYTWGLAMYAKLFEPSLQGMDAREVRGFTQLIAAVVDGLGLQDAMSPEKFPVDAAYEVFGSILSTWIESRENQTS